MNTPCLYLPPPAKSQGILALPRDWASFIGSESLGRVLTPPLVFWEIGKVIRLLPSHTPQGSSLLARLCSFWKHGVDTLLGFGVRAAKTCSQYFAVIMGRLGESQASGL